LPTESGKALAFLARLAAEFTAVLNLQNLLDHVMRVLAEETGFDSCGVALLAKQHTEERAGRAARVRAPQVLERDRLPPGARGSPEP
jgi:GAF domain-containing protein